MTKEMIEKYVCVLIAEEIGDNVETVVLTANLYDDLYMDSFDRFEVAMMIEEEFDVLLDDGEITKWQTVGDVVNNVLRTVENVA